MQTVQLFITYDYLVFPLQSINVISCILFYIFWKLYFLLLSNPFLLIGLFDHHHLPFLLWFKLSNSSSERQKHKQYGGTLTMNATFTQIYVMVFDGNQQGRKEESRQIWRLFFSFMYSRVNKITVPNGAESIQCNNFKVEIT